jgi:signal transduction histidine kinase
MTRWLRGRWDWRLMMMLLPARRFTPTELARAVPGRPSTALVLAVVFNVVFGALVLLAPVWPHQPQAVHWVELLYAAILLPAAWAVWHDPGCRAGRWAYYGLPLLAAATFGMAAAWHRPHGLGVPSEPALAVGLLFGIGSLGLWFTITLRHQHVVQRLAELDERDRAVAMAQQLGSAQIQPHFLFNTLASVQHWVATGDARAGPLLDALNAYLRATLPLFEQRWLALGQELDAAKRYLEVMQLRLGERLRFEIDADPTLLDQRLPPGLVLTLVENAVEHGVSPQLHGGTVRIVLRRDGQGLSLSVQDDGPGLPAQTPPHAAGAPASLGLHNCRARLAQAFGHRARLDLTNLPDGGCRAALHVPWQPEPGVPLA